MSDDALQGIMRGFLAFMGKKNSEHKDASDNRKHVPGISEHLSCGHPNVFMEILRLKSSARDNTEEEN